MSVTLPSLPPRPVVYPESDGKPMADNTKQARWIVILFDNLLALFADVADVFIAADMLWYPVEGEPEIARRPTCSSPSAGRGATAALTSNGRKGASPRRWSSRSFRRATTSPRWRTSSTSTSATASRSTTSTIRTRIPWSCTCAGARCCGGYDRPRASSVPRLKIRFQLTAPEMTVYRPDGRPFLMFDQLEAERVRVEEARRQAVERAEKAEESLQAADKRAEKAEAEVERLRRLLEGTGQPGGQA